MNHRLEQFLAAENISQSQFADTIGVARASISHILSGRNKPGYDFIESMARHYPSLNLEWAITGKGKMYKNTVEETIPQTYSGEIFKEIEESNEEEEVVRQSTPESNEIGKEIERIIVFYTDGTFEDYTRTTK